MKFDDLRRAAVILAIPLMLAVSAGPVAASTALPSSAASAAVAASRTAPNACADPAYNLEGGKWTKTYGWYYQSASTPSEYTSSAVLNVIKRSINNITNAYNDCGLPDNVSATNAYLGSTSAAPGVTKRGYCGSRDSKNVVGFGQLPDGVLAVTCIWTSGGKIVEADIRINSRYSWALTVASCHYWQDLLEPTVTHEAGHVFGLAHVGERKHGRLTMSTISDGPCDNAESTLGWGDILGLEHLY